MASVTRVSNSALRASLRTPAFTGRATGFNAVRCYSAKTQVRSSRAQLRFQTDLTAVADPEGALRRDPP